MLCDVLGWAAAEAAAFPAQDCLQCPRDLNLAVTQDY